MSVSEHVDTQSSNAGASGASIPVQLVHDILGQSFGDSQYLLQFKDMDPIDAAVRARNDLRHQLLDLLPEEPTDAPNN